MQLQELLTEGVSDRELGDLNKDLKGITDTYDFATGVPLPPDAASSRA